MQDEQFLTNNDIINANCSFFLPFWQKKVKFFYKEKDNNNSKLIKKKKKKKKKRTKTHQE
ncbi:hypothetical protein HanIR_Chr01g0023851 [Helianthus annuus]|nr:hypothetical protein HanIR_Chr01g0023851 [Helianthus annuus]